LGTGWSHKYRMLFEDFGCPENLVSPADPEAELLAKLDAITNGPDRSTLIASLRAARDRYTVQVERMWSDVNEILDDGPRSS
jgi:hypothetical protein